MWETYLKPFLHSMKLNLPKINWSMKTRRDLQRVLGVESDRQSMNLHPWKIESTPLKLELTLLKTWIYSLESLNLQPRKFFFSFGFLVCHKTKSYITVLKAPKHLVLDNSSIVVDLARVNESNRHAALTGPTCQLLQLLPACPWQYNPRNAHGSN